MKQFYLSLIIILALAQFSFAQPVVSSFSPATGNIGTSVTITGSGFNTTPASNIVFFGATRATVNTATATSLTVTAPAGATYQQISVLNTGTHLIGISTVPFGFINTFPSLGKIASGDLQTQQTYSTVSALSNIVFADLDGDGKADMIASSGFGTGDNSVGILQNTSTSGHLSFTPITTLTGSGTEVSYVAVGDLDGDGKPDIVFTDFETSTGDGSTITIYRNTSSSTGSFTFTSMGDFAVDYIPIALAIGDLDGDGKQDIAVVNNYYAGSGAAITGLSLLHNTSIGVGSISFAPRTDLTTGVDPAFVSIGDLDGDGKNDLVVGNVGSYGSPVNTVSVFHNTNTVAGTLSFAAQVIYTVGNGPYSANIADLDGDGKNDIITSDYDDNTISTLHNISSGPGNIAFSARQTFATGAGPSILGIGDLDGDGKPDVAAPDWGLTSAGTTVSVFRNTSTSSINFAPKVDFNVGSAPYGAAIGDLDGDGKEDLAVTNSGYNFTTFAYTGNTVSVLLNDPQIPLPLHLLSFTGVQQDNDHAQLTWKTSDEVNVSRYELEWSTDQSNWQNIATQPATDKPGINNYSYLSSLTAVKNYYRLKSIDDDGTTTLSNIVVINQTGGQDAVTIYPNPAKDHIAIRIGDISNAVINLINTNGQQVIQQNSNQLITTMDISSLPSGEYLLQVIQGDKTSIFKVIKE